MISETWERELKARLDAMKRERNQLRDDIDRISMLLKLSQNEVARLEEWRDDAINLYPDLERLERRS